MTYELAIGDRSYSSWSLRGWLFFEKFGIPVKIRTCVLYTDEVQRLLADLAPARLVPAVRTPEGEVIGESIAILETLAERHPGAGLWPEDGAARISALLDDESEGTSSDALKTAARRLHEVRYARRRLEVLTTQSREGVHGD